MDKNDFFIVRSPLSLNIGQFKGIDGFVGRVETEVFIFTFYADSVFFLKCLCEWNARKNVMEIEFSDEFGHRINQYFEVDEEKVIQLCHDPVKFSV